jgi:Ribose/xylose/arabinose/galactoside ABC-type transport systems, permease components
MDSNEVQVNSKKTKINMISSIKNKISGFREGALILVILVLIIVMANISKSFLTSGNMIATFIGISTDGIVVAGMTIALIAGDFDLSVGSLAGLAGVIAGKLFLSGVSIWIAALAAIVVVTICGVINGLLITKVGLSSFIATLGMMGLARGMCLIITKGTPLSLFSMPAAYKNIGGGKIIGIPYIILIFLIITIISDFLLRKTGLLRKVFYTGSNIKAAMYSGINTDRVKIGVFALTAFAASIAGIISIARFTVAAPSYGTGLEMTAISAAVIGGVSLSGGEGTILGAVLGIILLGMINSALVILNVSVYWQQMISSIILLVAVSFDIINHKRRSR